MESLTLTTPVSIPTYQISAIVFDWTRASIRVAIRASNGDIIKANYSGTTATNLMNQLNTINLSTQSLHSRVLQRLVADGFLPAGNITGAPD